MTALDGFSVLLVDDHPLFRDGLVAALQHQAPTMRVQAVDSVASAQTLLVQQPSAFDLALLDFRLPGADGLRCAVRLMAQHPDVGFGLMSGVDDPTLASRVRDAGLVAYFPKSLEISSLLRQLEQLANGEPCFGDDANTPEAENALGLTSRQTRVLQLLATGASNKEIARAMTISPATVKKHLEAIFSKTGAGNRMQAVMMAQTPPQD